MKMEGRTRSAILFFVILLAVVLAKPLNGYSEGTIKELLARMTQIEMRMDELTSHSRVSRQLPNITSNNPDSGNVYFTAQLGKDARGLVIGEKVIYTNAFSQEGGGYDQNTGIFTAPTSGVYLFSLFCHSLTAQTVTLVMKKDGTNAGSCIVEPSRDGEDEMGGQVYATKLSVGDKMWVEVYFSENTFVDLKKYVNSFTGVLIHR